MGDEAKTREQLIVEVEDLRRQCALVRAAEQIREEVLSMRSSEDIARVVAVMWREMVGLGIETPAASISFVAEGADRFPNYMAMANPRLHNARITSLQLREIDDQIAVLLPSKKPELSHYREHLLEVWREQLTESFEEEVSIPLLAEQMGLEGDYEDWLEGIKGKWTVTNVPFAHGTVGYRERAFVEEHAAVVGELARSLSLGYLRFLDFQRLEERNRELTIERALEQVRGEVAAMQESEDLLKIADVIREQLGGLGMKSDAVTINIIDEEEGKIWFPSSEESWGYDLHMPFKPIADVYSSWKKGKIFQRYYCEEGGKQYSRKLIDSGYMMEEGFRSHQEQRLSEEEAKFFRSLEWEDYLEQIPIPSQFKDKWVVDIPFAHGTLGLNRSGSESFSEADLQLMKRFTEVFSLGYVRYLDIREAEEQAQRANRERAAERVRAEAMAMRSGEELRNVVAVMYRELAALDESFLCCSINFVNEGADHITDYVAIENPAKYGVTWDSPNLVAFDREVAVGVVSDLKSEREDDYLERWQKGDVWSFEINKEQISAGFYRTFGAEIRSSLLDKWSVTVIPFALGGVSLHTTKYSEESIAIAREFTQALSLGYTRFLDFQRVEEAQQKLIDELEEELQTAREKQMGLMPKGAPEVEGIHLAGRCVPANHVGGDFFQYFPRDGERVSVCMADVTGHAMEAAIPVVMFDGVLESQMAMDIGLEELFERLNDLLCAKLDERTFVCFAMGEFDAEKGLLRLANGGIPYPLHFHRSSGEIVELQVEAYPLGVRSGVDYPVIEVQLEPGDRVVFCSDGLAEAENAEREIFSFERTAEAVRRGCVDGLSAEGLIERLFEEVKDFSGETPQGDDMTCVVLQVEG